MAWHVPQDLRYFYRQTKNDIVVMGNTTLNGLPQKLQPLPERSTVVVATEKREGTVHDKCMAVFGKEYDTVAPPPGLDIMFPPVEVEDPLHERISQLASATRMSHDMLSSVSEEPIPRDVWVAGGASIYEQLLPYCDEVHWTRIPGTHDCDTHFNPLDYMADDMKVVSTEELKDDEGNVVAVVEVWRS